MRSLENTASKWAIAPEEFAVAALEGKGIAALTETHNVTVDEIVEIAQVPAFMREVRREKERLVRAGFVQKMQTQSALGSVLDLVADRLVQGDRLSINDIYKLGDLLAKLSSMYDRREGASAESKPNDKPQMPTITINIGGQPVHAAGSARGIDMGDAVEVHQ